jgi:alpha-mannosidase
MALNEEWQRRIDEWQEVLWKDLYRSLGEIAFSGFVTKEQLSAQDTLQRKFSPMPPGTAWGGKWEYAWLKGDVIIPKEAAGKRINLRLNTGGVEALVWANGLEIGSVGGWAERELTLTSKAKAGEKIEVLIESYAGHGRIYWGNGPTPYGVETIPEPPPTQAVMGKNTFGLWLEDVYQLALDFTTLRELRDHLDPLSLRVAEIDEALMQATLVVDVEVPDEEMLKTVKAGRKLLKPLLEKKNGPTMPTLHAFGHAHLDVAWLWPWQETERKMARTIANALVLMEEYPDYKFLQSQAHLYYMLQNRYPDLYQRFEAAIKSGKIIVDGAMWVEADTNLSGGEALIRQVMYGQQFFREKFGVESKVLWLPDVFGYSGAVPQILKGCGCVGFATQKITWAYNGGEKFPYNTFWWEGIDGSAIPAHIYTDYNSQTHPNNIFERWNTRLQKNGIDTMILSFGWGDGGGGPTRDHLEYIARSKDLEGLPRVKISSPAAFFEDLKKKGLPKERYVGELYFQGHRGTYTSQAKTKKGNRRSEFALREAELWGTAARALKGFTFTPTSLEDPWRRLMLNQFHDVLPGSSIQRVYQEAEAEFDKVIKAAQDSTLAALSSLTQKAEAVTVFNSLSWPRKALVELPNGVAEVTVPACGWTTVNTAERPKGTPGSSKVKATRRSLENEFLRAEFNARGEITSLLDKESGREIMAGPGNRFHLYKDAPTAWDAWDIDSMAEKSPVETNEPVKLEVLSSGPLTAQLRLTRKLHNSKLSQIITLRSGSRRIDFATTVDWQENHRLLKVSFPVDIYTQEVIHEIQFGHLRRPNHRSRVYDQDRFEVCNHKWSALAEENRGVAVLNDSKYGLSVLGNSINLTLLKSALAPDMYADKGIQTFTYALYPWNGSLVESGVVREAYELNVPVLILPGAGGEQSLFSLDAANVIIEAVKPAEDGSQDIIVRLYEAKRMSTHGTLSTSLPVKSAVETDLVENFVSNLPCKDGLVNLSFRPFEIKTVRLKI